MSKWESLEENVINNNFFGVDSDIGTKYLNYVREHIKLVQDIGARLNISEKQLLEHDLTKYTKEQFYGYATHFFGGGNPKAFSYSWLNHLHLEKHHYHHWMFADNFSPKDSDVVDGCVKMPEEFVKEMIADWASVSFYYHKNYNFTQWYRKTLPKLHPETKTFLEDFSKENGFLDNDT